MLGSLPGASEVMSHATDSCAEGKEAPMSKLSTEAQEFESRKAQRLFRQTYLQNNRDAGPRPSAEAIHRADGLVEVHSTLNDANESAGLDPLPNPAP